MFNLGNNEYEEALGLYCLHLQNKLFASFKTTLSSTTVYKEAGVLPWGLATNVASAVMFHLWKTDFENKCSHIMGIFNIPG